MKLQFTNGYRPRFDQISRILLFLLSLKERKRIPQQEISTALGIPEKQVENLIGMMTGFGLVFPKITTLTPFGKAVIEYDPYFDQLETLWIIHYIVSSNPKWVVWYRIVNQVIPEREKYSVDEISKVYFSDLNTQFSIRTMTEKLPKEVGSVFAAYSRSELSQLGIIEEEKNGNFIKTNPVNIPELAFLYCLLYYRNTCSPGSSAVNIEDACLAEYSPGRVLNLPEYQVRTILGNLHDAGLIRLEQIADLDQVRLSDSISQETVLQEIYEGKNAI